MADVPAIRITAIDQASAVIGRIGQSLGGLVASVVSVSAAMSTFRQALDFGDQLQTANEKLGLSVAKLQELSAIAVQSNADLNSLGKSFKFLAESMVKAQNSASDQGRLFKALGVSVKDSQGNLRALEDVLPEVADALNKIGNETVRAAAGVAIFGKGYLENAAALRTYRQSQEEANKIIATFGTVTATAAQAADQLGDKVKLLGEGFKATTLNEMSRGFASLSASIDGSTKSVADFAAFIGRGFALDMRDGAVILTRFQQAFESLGVMATAVWESIKTRSREPLRQMGRDLEAIVQKYEAARGAIRSSFAAPGLGDNEDQVSRAARAGEVLADNSKKVAGALGDADVAAKKLTDSLEDLVKSQENALASDMKLTEVDKLYIALTNMKVGVMKGENLELVKRATAAAELRDKIKAEADALKLAADAAKEYSDAWVKKIEADEKAYEAQLKSIEAGTDLVKSMEEENKQLMMSNEEREKAIALQKLQATGINQLSDEYKNLKTQVEQAAENKVALQSQIDFWQKIDQTAHDTWMHIYEGGKSVFDRLKDVLRNFFLELAYWMAKKWVLNIVASAGLGGVSDMASAASNSMGSSIFGAAGSGLSGVLGGFADSIGLTAGVGNAALALGFSGETATLLAANAIPVVGTIIAAAGFLIYNWIESKKGGPKSGGYSQMGSVNLAGTESYGGRWFTPSDADAKMLEVLGKIDESYKTLAKTLGFKGGGPGWALGYDTDPQGTAPNRVHAGVFINGKQVYNSVYGDLGRDSAVLEATLQLEAKRMLIAALKASDLPATLGKLFAGIVPETITSEAADSLIAFADAYLKLTDVFNSNPLDDALEAVAIAAEGAQGALRAQGDALLDLLDLYDGSAAATTDLATATTAYYNSTVALLVQIEKIKQSISAMFESSIKTYTFATLDTSGQYKYLKDQAASMYKELASSTNADRINALAQMIDADMREAFGLLTPEQQAQMADQFIKGANDVNAAAAKQLQDVEQKTQDAMQSVLTQIQTAIENAANKIAGGGEAVAAGGIAVLEGGDAIIGAAQALAGIAAGSLVNR